MTTEKIRVSASSVISSVADTSATPARCRRSGEDIRESVPSANAARFGRTGPPGDHHMTARRLHIAFVSAAVVWAVLIVVAPFLASRAHASTFGAALTLAVYAIGSAVCH